MRWNINQRILYFHLTIQRPLHLYCWSVLNFYFCSNNERPLNIHRPPSYLISIYVNEEQKKNLLKFVFYFYVGLISYYFDRGKKKTTVFITHRRLLVTINELKILLPRKPDMTTIQDLLEKYSFFFRRCKVYILEKRTIKTP